MEQLSGYHVWFFFDSDAAFRRDRLMIVLRPCAVRHKFRICIGFTRAARWDGPYGIAARR